MPKASLRISQEGSRTLTINAITLGTGSDTAPVFKLMDSSGLAPLDLPPELAGASRQGEWTAPLPPPSQDAIAQFRSAMGESPQVRRQSPVAMAYGAVAANMAPQQSTQPAPTQPAPTQPVPTAPAAEQPNPTTPSVTPEAETVAQAQQPTSAQQPIQVSQKAQPKDEDDVSAITLQALPVAMPAAAPDVASAAIAPSVALEIDPAAATARTHELVEAASQVADTILVTPSLVSGEGEVTIRLMPTVLDGSEIRLEAKGSSISVTVTPTTQSVAQAVEQSRIQFEQQLTERLPSFQFAIAVEGVRGTGRKRGIEA